MSKQNDLSLKNIKLILIAWAFILIITAIYFSITVIITSLIGIGIGVIMGPALSYLRKKFKMPRALSALLCLLGVLVIFSLVTFSISFIVSDQVESLSKKAPEITENLRKELTEFSSRNSWISSQIAEYDIAGTMQNAFNKVFSGLRTSIEVFGSAIFALVLSLYVAVSLNDYFHSIVKAFPSRHREKAEVVLKKCAKTLRVWFRAQLGVMFVLGVITAIGLWIVGVQYWAVYGLLAAIFSLIPYVGMIIVVSIAVLITLASNAALVPWVVLVFIITQQIEGNVVLPLLMKEQVELPEAPLLIFMLFCGSWLGVIGVFLAPPLLAILIVLYSEIYLKWINSQESSSS